MKRSGFNIKEHEIKNIDIKKIKTDGDNPNVMTIEQEQSLAESMDKFGYIGPIVLDQNYVIADGEHRFKMYKEFGVKTIPAYVLKFENEGERKLFRQVANKLKGEHDPILDSKEYMKLIEAGYKDEIHELLNQDEREVQKILAGVKKDFEIPEENKEVPEFNLKRMCPKCKYEY